MHRLRIFIPVMLVLCLIICLPIIGGAIDKDSQGRNHSGQTRSTQTFSIAAVGDFIKAITVQDRARLLKNPHNNQILIRVPTNTKLKVQALSIMRLPLWDVIWYKVSYKGKTGWISEFDTDKAPEQPRYR